MTSALFAQGTKEWSTYSLVPILHWPRITTRVVNTLALLVIPVRASCCSSNPWRMGRWEHEKWQRVVFKT